jgi:hypothetical protein
MAAPFVRPLTAAQLEQLGRAAATIVDTIETARE